MFNILVVVGSLRKESFNRKLALALDKLNHPQSKFSLAQINDIPLFNQDLEQDLPAAVVRLIQEISQADAILLVTPEYNRSIPGVLKNIIDWGSRPYGQNSWRGKPTAIIGTSQGNVATACAQAHLRSIMVAIDAILLGLPEVYLIYKEGLIDEAFNITVESTQKFLQGFLERFAQWIELHHQNRQTIT
ncbi:MAG TPA: NADPH-dependent FMN reductase [Gammaproteobacteria bacterium]|nr:NADPH-dependent FMN reductase [Gammaproteobacteria bacterium]